MAALLPHKKLTYKPSGEILVDGKPTASMEQRSQILAPLDGLAVKSDELLDMKKDEGRKFISGTKLVYIYHNAIDAVGDSASTEAETFAAARRAIDELASIVSYVFNHLNGNHVVVILGDFGLKGIIPKAAGVLPNRRMAYWLVWCCHCEKWHRHGPAEGHREAHCQDWTSPYWKNGYNLAYAGKWRDRPRAGSSEAR